MNNQKSGVFHYIKVVLLYAVVIILGIFIFKGYESIVSKNNDSDKIIVRSVIPYLNSSSFDNENSNNIYSNGILSYLNDMFFNPVNIVKNQIPLFKEYNNVKYNNHINFDENGREITKINSYNVDSNSIIKLNPEEKKGTEGLSVSKAFNKDLVKQLNEGKPEVLIYHSHTMEAYGAASDSADTSQSVIGVGGVLQDELKKYGIASIHDTTISRSYDESYNRSRNTVSEYLKKYGDFKIIIDLHRDSVPNKSAITATLNGESMAKIMFVTANNNPHAKDNHALIDEMNNMARKLFPGLSRGITCYRNGKNKSFNQDLSKNALLIEVGSHVNTPKEAQTTAKYIARLIAEKINGKK